MPTTGSVKINVADECELTGCHSIVAVHGVFKDSQLSMADAEHIPRMPEP